MSSLKDAILGADDLKFRDVVVDEWGGITVRVRGLTDAQVGGWRAKSQALRMKARRDQNVDLQVEMIHRRAELLVMCLFDPETDKRIFVSGDAQKLSAKNAGVMEALEKVAIALSGLDKTFDEQVKAAEEDFSDGQS